MKSLLLPAIVALSAFFAGLAAAFYVAHQFEAHAWHDAMVAASQEEPWFRAETDSQIRLSNIEAAQRGDTQKIIHINCLLLKIGLPAIRPERFGSARATEVKAFQDHARSTIADLEKQGLCNFGSSGHDALPKPVPN